MRGEEEKNKSLGSIKVAASQIALSGDTGMANRSNEAFAGALQLHKRFIFSSDNAPCFTACFVRRSIFSSARPRVSYITETCYQHNDLNASHFQRLEVSKPLARSATSCLQRKTARTEFGWIG